MSHQRVTGCLTASVLGSRNELGDGDCEDGQESRRSSVLIEWNGRLLLAGDPLEKASFASSQSAIHRSVYQHNGHRCGGTRKSMSMCTRWVNQQICLIFLQLQLFISDNYFVAIRAVRTEQITSSGWFQKHASLVEIISSLGCPATVRTL